MASIKNSIAANFAGNIWAGLMGMVFVPLYIHFIGIEGYGLMGFFATLLALFALLDMGLTATMNREMARLSVQKEKTREMRDLARTLEIPYWLAGLAIALAVIFSSDLIATKWLQLKDISTETARMAVLCMGICVAFQWPMSLYTGGLIGLQEQITLNAINVAGTTLRGAGAVLVLWLISPTIEAFFIWQIFGSALHTLGLMLMFWRKMPKAAGHTHFRVDLLRQIRRFAAGMTALSVTSVILTQMDKIVLSRIISLEMFGYYALANTVALNLGRLIGPIHMAAYPRLTGLVELKAEAEMTNLYHKSAQLAAVAVLPAACVVALFSHELLYLWTQNPVTADSASGLTTLLVCGTAVNCMLYLPFALQIANGLIRLSLIANVVSILLLIPLMIALTAWYGAMGAATVWLILNISSMVIIIPMVHQRFLKTEMWRWYLEDIARPLLAALGVTLLGRALIHSGNSQIVLILELGLVSLAALTASALAANHLDFVARAKNFLDSYQVYLPTLNKPKI